MKCLKVPKNRNFSKGNSLVFVQKSKFSHLCFFWANQAKTGARGSWPEKKNGSLYPIFAIYFSPEKRSCYKVENFRNFPIIPSKVLPLKESHLRLFYRIERLFLQSRKLTFLFRRY